MVSNRGLWGMVSVVIGAAFVHMAITETEGLETVPRVAACAIAVFGTMLLWWFGAMQMEIGETEMADLLETGYHPEDPRHPRNLHEITYHRHVTTIQLPTEEMLVLENYISIVDPSRRFVSDTAVEPDFANRDRRVR